MPLYRRLAEAFYSRVDRDKVLRPLYGRSLSCPTRVLGDYFEGFFGSAEGKRHWWVSLQKTHLRHKIGPEHRDAWLKDMRQALDDCGIQDPTRSSLYSFFENSAAWMINQGAPPDPSILERQLDGADPEIARRWDGWRSVEGAVLALSRGDREKAIRLSENPAIPRAACLDVLSILPEDYVLSRLDADPSLARENHGKSLLHDAAGARRPRLVEHLLRHGADPDGRDVAGHTPLYLVGNAGSDENGAEVVRLLIAGGADVNARNGVTRATALHMAARRGNRATAQALVEAGADLTARDQKGDTPLERAINCRKREVAALLRC